MNLPPYGLCLPAVYRRARDGDTIEISVQGSRRVWAIRLIGVDCPEAKGATREEGLAAKRFAESVLEECDQVSAWIPAPRDVNNLLANLTFDRIPGHLFVSTDRTLGEMLVETGHAKRRDVDQ